MTPERNPFQITEVPEHVTVDDEKDGQYMQCKRCSDFRFLPWGMDGDVWFRAVQDFSFAHDACERRRDISG